MLPLGLLFHNSLKLNTIATNFHNRPTTTNTNTDTNANTNTNIKILFNNSLKLNTIATNFHNRPTTTNTNTDTNANTNTNTNPLSQQFETRYYCYRRQIFIIDHLILISILILILFHNSLKLNTIATGGKFS